MVLMAWESVLLPSRIRIYSQLLMIFDHGGVYNVEITVEGFGGTIPKAKKSVTIE